MGKIQGEIVTQLLKKFPKAGSLTIAKIAIRDNPGVFANLDRARWLVRYYRGAAGQKIKTLCRKEFLRPKSKPGDPFGKIPEGLSAFDEAWGPLVVDGPADALLLSDIHLPYHDKSPLVTVLKYGKANGANIVILNGDTNDCYAISKWEKDPRRRKFPDEIKLGIEFLRTVRKLFPKARIIFKHGNHEERFESYMRCRAPELLGVPDFEWSAMLKFKDFGIEEVKDKRPIRLGQLNVLHGHEYRFAISNPVNAARGLFLRCKAYALCGHFHQRSEHTEKTVEQKQVATWSAGCLCQLHQDYAPLNNWTHGAAFVRVEKGGKFEVKNLFISNGRVF